MIASYGGLEIDDNGARNIPGAGGLVGGLSMPGAGSSNFTGAGKFYNTFIPSGNASLISIDADPGDGGGNGGGGGGGGSGGGGVILTSGGGSGIGGVVSSTTMSFNVPSSPYRGLSAITGGGNSLIQALNDLFARYQAGQITLQEAILQANQLSSYLNNPQVFYQARHGKDATALQNFRAQASSIISAISSWFRADTTTDTTSKPIGNSGRTVSDSSPTEIPTQLPQSILDVLNSLTPSARTSVEQPPNLFSFNPDTQGSNSTMKHLLILAAIGFVGYWLYKKYYA